MSIVLPASVNYRESLPALVGERLVPYGIAAANAFNAGAVMANSRV